MELKIKDMKKEFPTQEQNPKGLYQRYVVSKIIGWKNDPFDFMNKRAITKAVDKDAEYFVLRLDKNDSDPKHITACRKAILVYAQEIKDHLPQLSKDLFERYCEHKNLIRNYNNSSIQFQCIDCGKYIDE